MTFSGGEPLLHKGFLTLTDELRKRRMKFCRLVTNLYHMTPELADELLAYNGEINSPDRRMCVFFKEGYYQRFLDIADKYGLDYDL